MTLMCAGAASALARCEPVFAAIAARVFPVGTRPGDAAKFKIVNNLLAAANLAAGAEAMALARRLGLDPAQVVDVVNASSGGSWIFADRMPRALAGDYAPRAAARILAKDVGIAAALAARHGAEATFARAAHAAFEATVAAGYGEADDAAIYAFRCAEARTAAPRPQPYAAVPAYVTKDGSTIRELAHPAVHGHRALSFAEATVPPGGTTRLHRHEASEEIYHVTAGHGRLVRGDETIAIAPGDTVVIPPRTPHALHNDGPQPLVVLCACSPAYAHADTTLLDAAAAGERAALLHGARPAAAARTRRRAGPVQRDRSRNPLPGPDDYASTHPAPSLTDLPCPSLPLPPTPSSAWPPACAVCALAWQAYAQAPEDGARARQGDARHHAGGDVRRRLLLVHGTALRQARRRASAPRRATWAAPRRSPPTRKCRPAAPGHTEVVQVLYDPAKVSYDTLLEVFWKNIDPTVKDRQFCDIGSQYRTGIFVHNDEQKRLAEKSLALLSMTKPFKDPIVTPVVVAGEFWPAEDYHQDYYVKNPVRYNYYRTGCGRDARLKALWGSAPK